MSYAFHPEHSKDREQMKLTWLLSPLDLGDLHQEISSCKMAAESTPAKVSSSSQANISAMSTCTIQFNVLANYQKASQSRSHYTLRNDKAILHHGSCIIYTSEIILARSVRVHYFRDHLCKLHIFMAVHLKIRP